MTTTYMVSCHDADDQEEPTEKEEKVNLEEIKVTKEEGSETHASEEAVALCAHCCDKMTFVDEDLLLGSKPHNRPLFCLRLCTRGKSKSHPHRRWVCRQHNAQGNDETLRHIHGRVIQKSTCHPRLQPRRSKGDWHDSIRCDY